jgi:hypothetical protein
LVTGVTLDKPPRNLSCHSELKGWLLDWIGKEKGDKVAWMMMLLYNLWQARNEARETERIEDPKTIAKRTVAGIEEWAQVHTSKPGEPTRVVERWAPPSQGWSRINVDGAFRSAGG